MGSYGRAFTLAGGADENGINAPASGGASKGTYTREAGFWSYYEVSALSVLRLIASEFVFINSLVWGVCMGQKKFQTQKV